MAHVNKEYERYYQSGSAAENYREFVPGHLYLYLYKNTHVIELKGLKDEMATTFINNAAVTAVIKDEAGEQIAGETWPLTLAYVAASNGNYRGTLTHALIVTVGARLWAEVEAVAAVGRLYRRVPVLVIE